MIHFSVHFETLGCKLNQMESEAAARSFSDAGFAVEMSCVNESSATDNDVVLCVVNTCTVTSKAEQKARRIIRLLDAKFPRAAIIVTGCYAQVEPNEIAKISDKIAVLPGLIKDRLADIPPMLLAELQSGRYDCACFAASLSASLFEERSSKTSAEAPFRLSTDIFLTRSRPFIKIQDGCNSCCTYCRIHLARGQSVSLDVKSILDAVNGFQRRGQKEVVFTAVNTGQYCALWKGQRIDFCGLLRILLEQTDGISFRISSLHPDMIDSSLCSVVSDARVRPHFHLSVQSGSGKVLKGMGRDYTAEQVCSAVKRLRSAKADPFLACDVIAGFPGETDSDFDMTMDMLARCAFAYVHAFPFSARPGTPAFAMEPRVPQSAAKRRVASLAAFSLKSKREYIERYIGKTVDAIAESRRRCIDGKLAFEAVSDNFIHCAVFSDTLPQAGAAVRVRLERLSDSWNATGTICEAFGKQVQ